MYIISGYYQTVFPIDAHLREFIKNSFVEAIKIARELSNQGDDCVKVKSAHSEHYF